MRKLTIAYLLPLAIGLIVVSYLLATDFRLSGIQLFLNYSARLSFMFFALAFSISGIHQWVNSRSTKWLLNYRRETGIAFALIHFIHLGLLLVKSYVHGSAFGQSSLPSLAGGVLTYTFIALMLLTSFSPFSSRISRKNWSRLHTLGGYTILITFTVAYIKHTLEDVSFLPLLIIVVSVWVIRVFTWSSIVSR